MTKEKTKKKHVSKLQNSALSFIILVAMLSFGILLSGKSAEYVRDGMLLAVKTVIPSSFTFMILSDFYTHNGRPEDIPLLKHIFKKTFGISSSGLGAFICGNIGGFPIGAKITVDTFLEGKIDKQSAQRLLALSSNPSCAFICGGVGLGMFGNIKIGLALLISVYISSVICGILSKSKCNICDFGAEISRQKYDFVASVKSAGMSAVSIISFVSTFSVLVGIIKNYIKSKGLLYILISILEVTNAVEMFANSSSSTLVFKVMGCAFALGFGGLSVMMQTAAYAKDASLSMKPYFFIKLAQGLISSLSAGIIVFLTEI